MLIRASLYDIRASTIGKIQKTRRGSKVGKHEFIGGFAAVMPKGNSGMFKREGRAALPIKEVKLPLEPEASVIDSTIENAAIIVRTLAAEVAKVVNKNTWNIKNVSPGEFISAEIDGFRPELDAYLVWMVDWSHQLHLGKSIWTENKIKPHTIIIEENVRE